MPNLKLFTSQEETHFNTPPKLSEQQWTEVISIIDEELKKCRSNYSKLGLALQFGYFQYSHKFFPIARYHETDIVVLQKAIPCKRSDFDHYQRALSSVHKSTILEFTGVTPFSKMKEKLRIETHRLITKQLRPKEIFFRLLEYLSIYNTEIPSAYQFSELITQEFNTFEGELLSKLQASITEDEAMLLESILEKRDDLLLDLPKLRSPNQSLRPGMIRQIVSVFEQIQEVYLQLRPIYIKLDMDKEALKHYASWTLVADNYQLQRFSSKYKKWIYLLAFIHYQYITRQDFLVDIFLQSLQHTLTKVERLQADQYAKKKKQHRLPLQNYRVRIGNYC